MTRSIRSLALAAFLILALGGVSARAEGFKMPQTAEEHEAVAKTYSEKAAAWRAEAAMHREMNAAYAAAHTGGKGPGRNPWAVKMEKHCMAIVKDAEKLAADAEWAAKAHQLYATELRAQK